jgi:hypothetical protein
VLKEFNPNHSKTLNGPHTRRKWICSTPEITQETSGWNGTNLDVVVVVVVVVDDDDDDDDVILFCFCHSQTPRHIFNLYRRAIQDQNIIISCILY